MVYWRSLADEADCKYARKCGRIIDTLFATVQPGASPEQCAAVHHLLAELGHDLLREAAKDTFHFSAANGSHRCVAQALHDAEAHLMVLSRLPPPPEPAPEPPPTPREPLATPAQVVEDLQETITPRPDETVLGEDTER
jgi:hypothetical protein